jgi:hypothetical protein
MVKYFILIQILLFFSQTVFGQNNNIEVSLKFSYLNEEMRFKTLNQQKDIVDYFLLDEVLPAYNSEFNCYLDECLKKRSKDFLYGIFLFETIHIGFEENYYVNLKYFKNKNLLLDYKSKIYLGFENMLNGMLDDKIVKRLLVSSFPLDLNLIEKYKDDDIELDKLVSLKTEEEHDTDNEKSNTSSKSDYEADIIFSEQKRNELKEVGMIEYYRHELLICSAILFQYLAYLEYMEYKENVEKMSDASDGQNNAESQKEYDNYSSKYDKADENHESNVKMYYTYQIATIGLIAYEMYLVFQERKEIIEVNDDRDDYLNSIRIGPILNRNRYGFNLKYIF